MSEEKDLRKELDLWFRKQHDDEEEEVKDVGLDAGGDQATVDSTQFTPTFGTHVHDPIRSKRKDEEDDEVRKALDEERTCEACWGVCRSCSTEVCKDKEKYDAFHTMDLIKSAEGNYYIAGYASPHVVDDEGHRIELPALKEGLKQFMFVPQFRNVMVAHTGIQVGHVVPKVRDSSGKAYTTKVDAGGLYVVCKLRDDIQPGREVIEAVKKGELNSFSIRGRGLEREFKCEDGRCFWSISKLELYEITACKRGVNPDATFVLLKSSDDPVMLSEEQANNLERTGTFVLLKQADVGVAEDVEIGGTNVEAVIDSLLDSFKKLLLIYMKGKDGE